LLRESTTEQQQYDYLSKRVQQQEESQRDILRVVKLLQSYNEN